MRPFRTKVPGTDEHGVQGEGGGVMERHMSLFDLCVLAVAGTVGSGVFALVGAVANLYAGPAAFVSFVLAGVACILSGLSLAELGSHFPAEGGAYAYIFATLGELPAFLTGWFLTLEFGVSGAAVARVWNDKLLVYLVKLGVPSWMATAGHPFCPLAALIQGVCAFILYRGVRVGKSVTAVMTVFKCILIAIMIGGAYLLFDADNMEPIAPYGVGGILQGGVATFFGYLGWDEVTILAGECKNPKRDIPLSIFVSIILITVVHVVAAVAMVGMMNYEDVNPSSAFAVGFFDRGYPVFGQVVALGELLSLPVVVLVCFLAQPRLLFAMAQDGLLPERFARLDSNGNMLEGIIFSGVLLTLVALCVPFASLNDVISAGVLLVFIMCNAAVIILRREPSVHCTLLLVLANILCFAAGFAIRGGFVLFMGGCYAGLAIVACVMDLSCRDRGIPLSPNTYSSATYRMPLVPYLPLTGSAVNWALFAELSSTGLRDTAFSLTMVVVAYVIFATRRERRWYSMVHGKTSPPTPGSSIETDRLLHSQNGGSPSSYGGTPQ